MPFELGIFFGAKRFGSKVHKNKVALIFEKTKFKYQQYVSDLNGIDTKAHNNNPIIVIKNMRDWLITSTGRQSIPDDITLIKEYREFSRNLPYIVKKAGLDIRQLVFTDFCEIVERAVKQKISLKKAL